MKQFTFTITSIFNDVQTWTVEAETIEDALVEVCRTCIEEDDTGWFFDLDDADVAELEKDFNFFRFTVDGYEYGAVLDNYYEEDPEEVAENPYIYYYQIMNILDKAALTGKNLTEVEVNALNHLKELDPTGGEIADMADANDCYNEDGSLCSTWDEMVIALRGLFESGDRVSF